MNAEVCTCTDFNCALHPRNHDKGCTPCISKNLKTREMPSCFFNLLEGAGARDGDGFESFARLVMKNNGECCT